MKAKLLMVAAALLMFAAVSFGQVASLTPTEMDQILTTRCDNTTPIPDGTLIYWYQDVNGNGVDDSDPLLPVCPGDPCPVNTFTFNTLTMNGGEILGQAGQFYPMDINWTYGAMPTVNRVYFRIYYPDLATWNHVGGVRWTSEVLNPAFESNFDLATKEIGTWTCTNGNIDLPSCTQTDIVTFAPNPGMPGEGGHAQNPTQFACAYMCPTDPSPTTIVKIGPVTNSVDHPRLPHVMILPGCTAGGCTSTNPGAANVSLLDMIPSTWTFVQDGGFTYAQATITGVTEGCVTLAFDFLLPVEMGTVTLVPGDNSATVNWNTRSEMNIARFEVIRDGEVIGTKAANNTATGAEYSFVDATAENGHIYTYELAVVGADDSRDYVYNGKVAPNRNAAKPTEYALGQNFPNPFNPTTTISFDIVDTNPVTLTVYNANGQLVTTLLNNVTKEAGRYNYNFDATNLTSGLYFYTVKVGNVFTATKKMLLVK